MKKFSIIIINFSLLIIHCPAVSAQLKWTNVDSLYQPLPSSVHIYFTNQPIDTGAFRAYYLIADLKDKSLAFTVDTTLNRRLTPQKFYEKNDKPILVVNCTFFSFATNRNVNVIVKNGDLICYDTSFVRGRGKDSLLHYFTLRSAIGINNKNEADIAWVAADSSMSYPVAFESPKNPLLLDKYFTKTANFMNEDAIRNYLKPRDTEHKISKWKMRTVVGGGPSLLQNGEVKISNEEEMLFAGKAINDKHPRTAMGYTMDGRLIVLVIQGRSESSGGATLGQEAQIFKDLGCWEALNLDGGGSSCMLVNGKETIKVSDITGERPVPAVFMIRRVASRK